MAYTKKSTPKRPYQNLVINIEYVSSESSFCASSAVVTPVNSSFEVRQDWDNGTDVVGGQTW